LPKKRLNDAEQVLIKGYEGMQQREAKIPGESKVRIRQAMERLVRLFETKGETGTSAEWRKKLEATAKPPE